MGLSQNSCVQLARAKQGGISTGGRELLVGRRRKMYPRMYTASPIRFTNAAALGRPEEGLVRFMDGFANVVWKTTSPAGMKICTFAPSARFCWSQLALLLSAASNSSNTRLRTSTCSSLPTVQWIHNRQPAPPDQAHPGRHREQRNTLLQVQYRGRWANTLTLSIHMGFEILILQLPNSTRL